MARASTVEVTVSKAPNGFNVGHMPGEMPGEDMLAAICQLRIRNPLVANVHPNLFSRPRSWL